MPAPGFLATITLAVTYGQEKGLLLTRAGSDHLRALRRTIARPWHEVQLCTGARSGRTVVDTGTGFYDVVEAVPARAPSWRHAGDGDLAWLLRQLYGIDRPEPVVAALLSEATPAMSALLATPVRLHQRSPEIFNLFDALPAPRAAPAARRKPADLWI